MEDVTYVSCHSNPDPERDKRAVIMQERKENQRNQFFDDIRYCPHCSSLEISKLWDEFSQDDWYKTSIVRINCITCSSIFEIIAGD